MMGKRYRIIKARDRFYPQYKRLWFFWFSYQEMHQGGGSSPVVFARLDEAVDYVYQDIEQVAKALVKPIKATEVWSHD